MRLSDQPQGRIRIRDIAERTGVSIGTVDRVLHNRGEVKGDTYERVMDMVRELGYTPNLLAKSLALKKDFHIAALIPEADDFNSYWKHPLAGIGRARSELKDFNTHISVYGFDQRDEGSFSKSFDRVLADSPQGIILAPQFQEAAEECLRRCEALDIPVILVDSDLESGNRLACYGQDARQSGEVAARLMYTALPESARVLILQLTWNKVITQHIHRRVEGFLDFGHRTGIRPLSISTLDVDLSGKEEPETTLTRVFGMESRVDGLFVPNSRVHRVAAFLQKKGIQGTLLIGYDLMAENMEYLRSGTIDFLICQKPEEQGYRSVMAMHNYLLTRLPVTDIHPSPIDILVKENLDSYLLSNYTALI